MAYNLPTTQTYLTENWLKELNIDMVETVKKMMIPGRNFCTRPSGEYEASILCTPYRFIALMLNRIFGRENGKSFKIGWYQLYFFMRPKVPFLIGRI